jgi:hypothetical protein
MGDLLQPWHLILLFGISMFPLMRAAGTIALWFICKRAGFHPALSLLNLIPFGVGTIVLLFVLAFSTWKAEPAQKA